MTRPEAGDPKVGKRAEQARSPHAPRPTPARWDHRGRRRSGEHGARSLVLDISASAMGAKGVRDKQTRNEASAPRANPHPEVRAALKRTDSNDGEMASSYPGASAQ